MYGRLARVSAGISVVVICATSCAVEKEKEVAREKALHFFELREKKDFVQCAEMLSTGALKVTDKDKFIKILGSVAEKLGKSTARKEVDSRVVRSFGLSGTVDVTFFYVSTYERGDATESIRLLKNDSDVYEVAFWNINSPALLLN